MIKDVIFQLSGVPRKWLIPRKDRAILAIIGIVFWGGTIGYALTHPSSTAGVFSLFGLGLAYLIFSLFNLFGGLKIALEQHANGTVDESHPRPLIELFIVLVGMLLLNGVLLTVYIVQGTSLSMIDTASIGIDIVLVVLLFVVYGLKNTFTHPIARGWLAIACKTVPQIVLALLFLANPNTAYSLALITLLGIDALSLLRFVPTLKAYLRDTKNQHLQGLLLGEAGNAASGLLLTGAWCVAHLH